MADVDTPMLLFFLGAFCMLASAGNWRWFFGTRKVARVVRLMGHGPARVFYFVVGFAVIALAFNLR